MNDSEVFYYRGKNKYKCTECGAEDSDRSNEPPIALICWNCRAGRKHAPSEQIRAQIGMIPIMEEAGA